MHARIRRTKPPLTSYVVRVYRPPGGSDRQMVGVVETAGRAGERVFRTAAELWDIIGGNLAKRSARCS